MNKKGIILASVLFGIVIASMLGAALLQYSVTNTKQVIMEEQSKQAYYLARAGLVTMEDYLQKMSQQLDVTEYNQLIDRLVAAGPSKPVALGAGEFWVQIKKDTAGHAYVESTGKVGLIQKILDDAQYKNSGSSGNSSGNGNNPGNNSSNGNNPGNGNNSGSNPGNGNSSSDKDNSGSNPGDSLDNGGNPVSGGIPSSGDNSGNNPGNGNNPGTGNGNSNGSNPGLGNNSGNNPGSGYNPGSGNNSGSGNNPGLGNSPGSRNNTGNNPGNNSGYNPGSSSNPGSGSNSGSGTWGTSGINSPDKRAYPNETSLSISAGFGTNGLDYGSTGYSGVKEEPEPFLFFGAKKEEPAPAVGEAGQIGLNESWYGQDSLNVDSYEELDKELMKQQGTMPTNELINPFQPQ